MNRIAIFNTNLGIGGISSSLVNLLNADIMMQYEIDLFLTEQGQFEPRLIPAKIHVHCLKGQYSNRLMYDVAVDYNGYNAKCTEYALKTKAWKHIAWVHSDYFRRYQYNWKFRLLWQSMKQYYKVFDVLVFVSTGARDGFEKLYQGNIADAIVIPNRIDCIKLLEKSREPIDIRLNQNYHLVSVGTLCRHKNVAAQIRIFEAVHRQRNDIDFYIIGQGKEQRKLEKAVRDKHLGNSVHFLGKKENPYAYMARMDGLIFTSLYEGQGMVVREAQFLGMDLFVSENLQQCNAGIKATENMTEAICSARKKDTKNLNFLEAYNTEIAQHLEKLFAAGKKI